MARAKKPYTIRYRKDTKSWQADVFAWGKRHKKLFLAREDAERWAAGLRADCLRQVTGLQKKPETPSFGQVCALFVREAEATLADNTVKYYRFMLGPATRAFGTVPISMSTRFPVT